MKLIKACIENFRLLKGVTVDLDNKTTVIVGKNNSGKTSFSQIFRLFLDQKRGFSFDDFSIACHKEFTDSYEKYIQINDSFEEDSFDALNKVLAAIPCISLEMTIRYDDTDNWTLIKPFLTNLEDNDELTIKFSYKPKRPKTFFEAVAAFRQRHGNISPLNAIRAIFAENYEVNVTPDVKAKEIAELLQYCFIDAQRGVDDSNSTSSNKLSGLIHSAYNRANAGNEHFKEDLQISLLKKNEEIDVDLDEQFKDFYKYLKDFGFPALHDNEAKIKSQLNVDSLFNSNVKLFHQCAEAALPEKYNGLGYSNLFYITLEIYSYIIKSLEADDKSHVKLLFIEEPEAHMHPQMARVFIRNIEKIFENKKLSIQVILTTHSSHIIANTDFTKLRYFKKSENDVEIKDLHTIQYAPDTKTFLSQYFALDKCDLFFADKIILVEGTVERLLLPLMIDRVKGLQTQYVSVVEVGGAHAHKFKELLYFLGIKTLIITDIDPVDKDKNKAMVDKNKQLTTSNAVLSNWIPCIPLIDDLLAADNQLKIQDKIFRVAYQVNNHKPAGRSFEEAFAFENKDFLVSNKDNLTSIKNHLRTNKLDTPEDFFKLQKYIDDNKKKVDFACDLLTLGASGKNLWKTPHYIKEGLEWLAK